MEINDDFIIVGGGIAGLTVARELLSRGYRNIVILGKESKLGVHSSGRNSGVLHTGIYYATDSLKSEVCARGSTLMQEYAKSKCITCIKTGKVVVASGSSRLPSLEALFHRAKALHVERIDLKQLRELEPEALSTERVIHSPQTAVIDPGTALTSLENDLAQAGIEIIKGAEVYNVQGDPVLTTKGSFQFGHFVNCAGLYADRVAHWMGVALDYRILPFKGVYQKLAKDAAARFRGSIYPTPDLGIPFLGVHITRNVKGEVYVGPTAIPAFGRENYGIIRGLSLRESPRMFCDLGHMLVRNHGGVRQMLQMISKYRFSNFAREAQLLAPDLCAADFIPTDKVGIRAQLVDGVL